MLEESLFEKLFHFGCCIFYTKSKIGLTKILYTGLTGKVEVGGGRLFYEVRRVHFSFCYLFYHVHRIA